MAENETVTRPVKERATRARRADSDDDESDTSDHTPAVQPQKAVGRTVRKAQPAVRVPAAAVVAKPAEAVEHADPCTPADADGAKEETETGDSNKPAAASGPAKSDASVADDLFSLDYDQLSYEKLLHILHTIPLAVVAEIKAEREQASQVLRQQQLGQRVERFLDAPVGQTGPSDATAAHKDGYSYLTMLNRLFEALNLNHENSAIKERNQLPVPVIEKIGKKKTVISNFGRICAAFNRSMEDVKDFIEKELSIRGNLDSNDALILKFEIRKATDFDRILIKYLDEFVKCNSCHRIDTTLTKDGRLTELRCNLCTATRTVQAVGSAAFSAQVEKRSRVRAAAAMTL